MLDDNLGQVDKTPLKDSHKIKGIKKNLNNFIAKRPNKETLINMGVFKTPWEQLHSKYGERITEDRKKWQNNIQLESLFKFVSFDY